MKVIRYVSEENDKLYDVDTIRKVLKTSKTKVQRELKRHGFSMLFTKYENRFLYPEEILFSLMENRLIEKLEKEL